MNMKRSERKKEYTHSEIQNAFMNVHIMCIVFECHTKKKLSKPGKMEKTIRDSMIATDGVVDRMIHFSHISIKQAIYTYISFVGSFIVLFSNISAGFSLI